MTPPLGGHSPFAPRRPLGAWQARRTVWRSGAWPSPAVWDRAAIAFLVTFAAIAHAQLTHGPFADVVPDIGAGAVPALVFKLALAVRKDEGDPIGLVQIFDEVASAANLLGRQYAAAVRAPLPVMTVLVRKIPSMLDRPSGGVDQLTAVTTTEHGALRTT